MKTWTISQYNQEFNISLVDTKYISKDINNSTVHNVPSFVPVKATSHQRWPVTLTNANMAIWSLDSMHEYVAAGGCNYSESGIDNFHSIHEPCAERNLILIYKCTEDVQLVLYAGIAHQHGPVWRLEWNKHKTIDNGIGQLLATCGDGSVQVYTVTYVKDDQVVMEVQPDYSIDIQTGIATCATWLPSDPMKVLIGSSEGYTLLWGLGHDEPMRTFMTSGILQTSKQHGWSYIQDIDVDLNDGNVFVTAAQGGVIRLWDLRNPNQCLRMVNLPGWTRITRARWSPVEQNSIIVCGTHDAISMLNVSNGRARGFIKTKYAGNVFWDAAYCPAHPGLLATCTSDGRVQLVIDKTPTKINYTCVYLEVSKEVPEDPSAPLIINTRPSYELTAAAVDDTRRTISALQSRIYSITWVHCRGQYYVVSGGESGLIATMAYSTAHMLEGMFNNRGGKIHRSKHDGTHSEVLETLKPLGRPLGSTRTYYYSKCKSSNGEQSVCQDMDESNSSFLNQLLSCDEKVKPKKPLGRPKGSKNVKGTIKSNSILNETNDIIPQLKRLSKRSPGRPKGSTKAQNKLLQSINTSEDKPNPVKKPRGRPKRKIAQKTPQPSSSTSNTEIIASEADQEIFEKRRGRPKRSANKRRVIESDSDAKSSISSNTIEKSSNEYIL